MLKIKYQLKERCDVDINKITAGDQLGFGVLRTDHMFVMNYFNGGWQNPRVVPYGDLQVAPGAIGLNYSQSVFEGIKAFKHSSGSIYIYRADQHAKRFNHSAKLMCMPTIPVADQLQAISSLIDVERDWCPHQVGSSLYIRPLLFADEDCLGVRPSQSFTYCIFLSPSGEYYPHGLSGISLLLTRKYQRVLPWGIGTAKTGLNYGSSLYILRHAKKLGAQQMLFADKNGKYIEEAGTMNHFHVTKDRKIIISKFTDSVLKSVTSQSFVALAKRLGYQIKQERILYDDFVRGIKGGHIKEAGGLGTAAVVTPVVRYIFDDGKKITVGDGKVGSITKAMYKLLTDIQSGKAVPPKGWFTLVKHL